MPNFSLFSVFLLLGVVQGVVLAVLLFKKKRPLNIFLGLLIFNIALDLFSTFLSEGHLFDYYPNLYFIPVNYNLGYGPLIYFTTIYFVTPGIKLRKIQYLNFLPVALQGLFYWVVFWLPLELKGQLYRGFCLSVILPIEYYGTILSMFINLFSSYNYVIKHRDFIIRTCSFGLRFYSIAKLTLYLFTLLLIVWILAPSLLGMLNLSSHIDILDILLVLTIYALGITALNYNTLIKQAELETALSKNVAALETLRVVPITDNQLEKLTERLKYLLEQQEIYKNPDLSLKILADQLNTNVKVVSYVINSGMNLTFNNLINSHRVIEVQRQIDNPDNDHLTLLGIAYNSGVNSKSSFNLIFKQNTGFTPKEYKIKIKEATSQILV